MKTSSRRIRSQIARFALALALAGLVPLSPVRTAVAQASDRVPVNVIVVHTSEGEGGVDPRARELDEKLKKQLRYKSIRVLQEERVDLEMNQVGTVQLPDGRTVRMRPMHKGAKGVLMAVDVQGAVKLDARARNHHKVVIGAGEYEDGNLAVSIEPDYED